MSVELNRITIGETDEGRNRDKIGESRVFVAGEEMVLTQINWDGGWTQRTYERKDSLKARHTLASNAVAAHLPQIPAKEKLRTESEAKASFGRKKR